MRSFITTTTTTTTTAQTSSCIQHIIQHNMYIILWWAYTESRVPRRRRRRHGLFRTLYFVVRPARRRVRRRSADGVCFHLPRSRRRRRRRHHCPHVFVCTLYNDRRDRTRCSGYQNVWCGRDFVLTRTTGRWITTRVRVASRSRVSSRIYALYTRSETGWEPLANGVLLRDCRNVLEAETSKFSHCPRYVTVKS